jgi:hypothetical protein
MILGEKDLRVGRISLSSFKVCQNWSLEELFEEKSNLVLQDIEIVKKSPWKILLRLDSFEPYNFKIYIFSPLNPY